VIEVAAVGLAMTIAASATVARMILMVCMMRPPRKTCEIPELIHGPTVYDVDVYDAELNNFSVPVGRRWRATVEDTAKRRLCRIQAYAPL
jgi:hypothetical protein